MSASFSDSFANTFHIGKVQRKPMRKEIASIRSKAAKLPKTKDQQDLLLDLQKAAEIVDKSVKTNVERESSLQIAEKLMVGIRQQIQTLQSAAPNREDVSFKTKTVTDADKNRAAELLKLVEVVETDIEAMFAPVTGKLVVNMQSSSTIKAYERGSLRGQAGLIRLTINSTIVDEKGDTTIRDQIKALRDTMKEANTFADEVRNDAAGHEPLIERGRKVLAQLGKSMGTKAAQSPLSQKVEALNNVLHPERGVLDPTGMDTLSDALQQELDDIDAIGLRNYGKTATTQIDGKVQGEDNVRLFDTAADGVKINDKLEALRLLSEPLDSPDHKEVSNAIEETRGKIRALDPKYLKPQDHTKVIVKDIEDRTTKLQGDLDTLFNSAGQRLAAVTKDIGTLQGTRTAPVLAMGKKKQPAFQADWKEIDAMMASIGKMMPKSAKGMQGQDISNLAAVEPLIEAVKKLVDGITQKNDPSDAASVVGDGASVKSLDVRLANHKAALKEAARSGQPLQRFNKDDLAKFKEDFDKFEKGLPAAKASAASDGLKKLEKAFADKLKTAQELADYVDTELDPKLQPLRQIYLLALAKNKMLPYPNTQVLALDALTDERNAKPPDKNKLEKLAADVFAAFKDIKTQADLLDKANASYDVEKQKKSDKKAADKQTKAPLSDRLAGLKRDMELAEHEVDEAKGDKNVLKQIERMIEQADGEIDAVDDKGATKTMDRIRQHLDLVLANPKGEVARRRQELPGLYNEWARIRDTASKNLETVKSMVLLHQPDPKTAKQTAKLGRRIEAYRKAYATGHGKLRHLIGTLADDEQPDQARRAAREEALATISELERGLRAHPLSQLLAKSPIAAARAVPGRLMAGLDRLNHTILTSVE